MKKILFQLLLIIGPAAIVVAQPVQDKTQLEKERKEIQRELTEIQGMYNKVKGQTKLTLGQLGVLKRKLNLQEQYLASINKEIRSIDDDIYLSNIEIYRLQKQLDTLKMQYAKTVVYAYKNRSNYDYLNFIFSSNSFNDAVRRISYLKNIRAYREKKVNNIKETQLLISKRKEQQLGRKEQKNVAITNHTKQVQELASQKRETDAVVSKLKSQEKDLKGQIADKKKKDAKLKGAILAIIEKERLKAVEEEKKRLAALDAEKKKNTPTETKTTGTETTKTDVPTEGKKKPVLKEKTYIPLNANETALAANFKSNFGRLPWPVDNGVVCSNFGSNKIEGTLLTEDNPGITICTPGPGVTVKSVFDGEVLSVFNLGDGMSVMIKHGNYYTIYSNLTNVSVSKGTSVRTGQAIAKAGGDENGGGKVDFLLMIDKKNVNPQSWLHR